MKLSRRERRQLGIKKVSEMPAPGSDGNHETIHQDHQHAASHAPNHSGRDHEKSHGHAHHGHAKKGLKETFKAAFDNIFDKNYKKTIIIPLLCFIISIVLISHTVITTGDFLHKDISLKGGMTITIQTDKQIDIKQVEDLLGESFKENEINVRSLSKTGEQIGMLVDADLEITDNAKLSALLSKISEITGIEITKDNYTVEMFGSSLSKSFFKETIIAILIAFVLMSIVVLIAFKNFMPSLFVMLAAFCTLIDTLAVVDLIGMKVSTAGVAAFLMLIGYSVDTDILLTTRVMKREIGTIYERSMDAMRTGLNMTMSSFIAVLIAFIFTPSEVLKQIMTVLMIGLAFDMINTWLQNAVILRYYIEHKHKKQAASVV